MLISNDYYYSVCEFNLIYDYLNQTIFVLNNKHVC